MSDKWLGRRLIAQTRLLRDELRVTRAVRTLLDAHKERAMATVRAQVLTASVPVDAFDLTTWDGEVDEDVAPIIVAIFRDQADATIEFLKLPPDLRAQVLGLLDIDGQAASFQERIKGVGPKVAARLEDALREGINRGESISKLADRVDECFRYGRSNAETIARTETHGAAESTGFDTATQAAVAAGMALTKRWLATHDARTREDHAAAEDDNQEVPIDEPFIVGGDELMYPGDPDGSAEQVVNCRCTAIYEEAGGGESEVSAE